MSVAARLAVVVLNWNNAEDTLECLGSLSHSAMPLHVIAVDNGSTDGSLDEIEESALADDIVRCDTNLGYAGGNNEGLQRALAGKYEFVAVLNNDTLASPELFGDLLAYLDKSPGPSAISPAIHYADEPDRVWFAGGIVDRGWPRHLQANELSEQVGTIRTSQTLTGCCILARRDVWLNVGTFDPRYFLIFEDSDWSLRATARGVSLLVATDCVLLHKLSRSFRGHKMALLGRYYFVRNGIRFSRRHAPRFLAQFLMRWVLRPTVGSVRRREFALIAFTWAGALAAVLGQAERAPRSVEGLAYRVQLHHTRIDHRSAQPRKAKDNAPSESGG